MTNVAKERVLNRIGRRIAPCTMFLCFSVSIDRSFLYAKSAFTTELCLTSFEY
jgi:hypothetical protein